VTSTGMVREEAIKKLFSRDRSNKGDSRGAWRQIASNVPSRTVQSVYQHAYRRFEPSKTGRWTAKEDRLLEELVGRHQENWSLISKELGRRRMQCRDRWRLICEDFRTGHWKPYEDRRLVKAVRIEVGDDEVLGNKQRDLPWKRIYPNYVKRVKEGSKRRSRQQCRKRWYNTLQYVWRETLEKTERLKKLVKKKTTWTDEEDKTLLKAIIDSGIEEEGDIEFGRLLESKGWHLSNARWQTLRGNVASDIATKKDFQDLVSYMHRVIIFRFSPVASLSNDEYVSFHRTSSN